MKGIIKIIVLGSFLINCSKGANQLTDSDIQESTLAMVLKGNEIALSNVIACAGSNPIASEVRVYLYPRPGATNIRYFETESIEVNSNDFENYKELKPPIDHLFNGYLQFFEVSPATERWVIISFEEEGVINLSNPIRFKHLTQATEYLPENVSISNAQQSNMPEFSWTDSTFEDAIIYFHVVSNIQNDLLSGTYTQERNFQYYVLDNVVLNITIEEPPALELNVPYNFTLLAVTEDNWVNLFAKVPFELE